MAADVAQDAAALVEVKEPRRPRRGVQPVRSHADHLQNTSDGATIDQVSGVDRALGVESLAVVDRILPAGGCSLLPSLLQLFQGCHWRLIGEVVLAVFHDLAAQLAAQVRNRR